MSSNFYRASAKDFQKIPGSPVAYWVSNPILSSFEELPQLSGLCDVSNGIQTGNNERYVRNWHEVSHNPKLQTKWFPYNKGGEYRKWYGNNLYYVNWKNNGASIKSQPNCCIRGEENYFSSGITWSDITSSKSSFKLFPDGHLFDAKGPSAFFTSTETLTALGYLNSILVEIFSKFLNPTLSFQIGEFRKLPYQKVKDSTSLNKIVNGSVSISQADWDNYETSWDFTDAPLLRTSTWELDNSITGPWKGSSLETSWNNWKHYCDSAIARMQELETENNRLWIEAYGLEDELTPEVPEEEITLARADQAKDMAAFLSYAVGCMMGRFSLNAEGLIMANSGETLEDYLAKVNLPLEALQFAPDDDGIIPVLDDEWFDDDIVGRTEEFLRVTFGDDTLKENVDFIEQSLGKSLRKYFCSDFYKNHISNERAYGYKKRPIYWLVQSPKKSFQALIYLHRYTKDTMNLVLNNYLREFEAKLENRLDHLAHIITSESASSPDKTKAQKETDQIKASLNELDDWQKDILFPIASQRIELDLDDGVKANYPKLGKTLAKIPGVSTK